MSEGLADACGLLTSDWSLSKPPMKKMKMRLVEIMTQEKKKNFPSGVRHVDENSLEGEIYIPGLLMWSSYLVHILIKIIGFF